MKSAFFSLAFVIGLAAAQSVDGIPECAKPCVLKYTSGNAIAGCKNGNIKCICENESFLSGIACCLTDACDDSGKAAAVKFAQQICSTAGVTVPDEVVCDASASTASVGTALTDTATGSSVEEATGSPTATATDAGAGSPTASVASATSPAAAAGLSGTGGVVGAILAMMMAL